MSLSVQGYWSKGIAGGIRKEESVNDISGNIEK